jgi:hypothetical protein
MIYERLISLDPTNFTNSAHKILQDINKWFTTNLLSLNADNTQYSFQFNSIQFIHVPQYPQQAR